MFSPINRILYSQTPLEARHTFIFICGIHGNETAGYDGLKRVINYIKKNHIALNCNFYALTGNINALEHKVRFIDRDLNRLWTHDHIKKLTEKNTINYSEAKEQLELLHCIKTILDSHNGTFIFADIHTTSSTTVPFITISDSLNNRAIASKFSLPIILGIEEHLDGPLLTYINEFGHIALGFEAGEHHAVASIDNCEAFVWSLLSKMKGVDKQHIPIHKFNKRLRPNKTLANFYEINYRYGIEDSNTFNMHAGFLNFALITKNQVLAIHRAKPVKASKKGRIFLPLYQNQGDDGFFIISKISNVWLQVSYVLRKLRLSSLLIILPGVKQDPTKNYVLVVNPKTAKFLVIKLFHVFGYRKRITIGDFYYFVRRDRKIIPMK